MIRIKLVYEQHAISDFEAETDWSAFEHDIALALTPALMACCRWASMSGRVIAVVYTDSEGILQPGLACPICGRILCVDYELYDKRVQQRALNR